MTTPPTSKQDRHERLAEIIFAKGTVRVEDLQDEVGVSAMTLYRDLAELERRRVIIRTRGEVSAAATSLSETSFSFRITQETAPKTALAKLAAPLINRGDSVLVDDSSTAYFALQEVLGHGRLTVVTNCQGPAQLISSQPQDELIVIGGRFLPSLQACYGQMANRSLSQLRVDIALLGAAAIQEGRVFHPYEDVASFKAEAVAQAAMSVLMVTASKFERTALYEVATLDDFDVVITDRGTDPWLTRAAEAGVRVLRPH